MGERGIHPSQQPASRTCFGGDSLGVDVGLLVVGGTDCPHGWGKGEWRGGEGRLIAFFVFFASTQLTCFCPESRTACFTTGVAIVSLVCPAAKS